MTIITTSQYENICLDDLNDSAKIFKMLGIKYRWDNSSHSDKEAFFSRDSSTQLNLNIFSSDLARDTGVWNKRLPYSY